MFRWFNICEEQFMAQPNCVRTSLTLLSSACSRNGIEGTIKKNMHRLSFDRNVGLFALNWNKSSPVLKGGKNEG